MSKHKNETWNKIFCLKSSYSPTTPARPNTVSMEVKAGFGATIPRPVETHTNSYVMKIPYLRSNNSPAHHHNLMLYFYISMQPMMFEHILMLKKSTDVYMWGFLGSKSVGLHSSYSIIHYRSQQEIKILVQCHTLKHKQKLNCMQHLDNLKSWNTHTHTHTHTHTLIYIHHRLSVCIKYWWKANT